MNRRQFIQIGTAAALPVHSLFAAVENRSTEDSTSAGENISIAVVHGATFGDAEKWGEGMVEVGDAFTIDTPAGMSPPITLMRYRDVPFYFVRGHIPDPPGTDLPPGRTKVTTWAALYQLGVKQVFGGDVCGSINRDYDFDDLVVVDDFLLLDNQRPQSILNASGISRPGIFPDFQVPFCPDLRRLYIEEARKNYAGRVFEKGVVLQDDPGRFETPAEIRRMRLIGADLVTHNVVTEAVYARQLGMHFALLNSVSNPAVGVKPFTFKDMQESVQRIARGAVPILLQCIVRAASLEHTCGFSCIGQPVEGTFTDPESKKQENVY